MKIILSGGGTIGSVTPLLAIAEKMPEADILFVGTKNGPEQKVVESNNIKFQYIFSAKWRRYFSLQNIIDLFKLKLAFCQSFFLLIKQKPDVIVSAGSFVAVPLVWAAWFLRIPSVVHSQDIKTGLAIKLVKPFSRKITKTFSGTELKAEVIGNPVRNLKVTTNDFKFTPDKPVVLVTGGGTGALSLNKLIAQPLCEIAQIIHVTGENKNINKISHPDYFVYKFLESSMTEALNKADLVITRAGLGTLTELSVLGKPTIIIPMPDSHQEQNAKYFSQHKAAIILNQKQLTSEKLNSEVQKLLDDKNRLQALSNNIKSIIKPHAADKLAKIIKEL